MHDRQPSPHRRHGRPEPAERGRVEPEQGRPVADVEVAVGDLPVRHPVDLRQEDAFVRELEPVAPQHEAVCRDEAPQAEPEPPSDRP